MRFFISIIFIFISAAAFAIPAWKIVPEKSKLTFQAVQNNSPLAGNFQKFTGDIVGDPAHLEQSKIRIEVFMSSVSADYDEVQNTLKEPDWFDVNVFPKAIFTSSKIKIITNNSYEADGTLTIRNKTVPIKLFFELQKYSDKEAIVVGKTTLQRTQFGVGQGEWASTGEIKDEVLVNFNVTLTH